MAYGDAYVAQIAMGANDTQTVKAFVEAEAWRGPSILIAYSHCIAHGINMSKATDQQKRAVDSGHWMLYRYNPALLAEGKNPMVLDSRQPTLPIAEYMLSEARYKMLTKSHPDAAERFLAQAQRDATARWRRYEQLVALHAAEVGAPAGAPRP